MKQQDGTIFQFLSGSHSFEGVWFGDPHPDYPGRNFWWRPFLTEALEERDMEIAGAAFDEGQKVGLTGYSGLSKHSEYAKQQFLNSLKTWVCEGEVE